MSRKEFLVRLWKVFIKPTVLVILLVFMIKFLINIFASNGPERMTTILVLGFAVLYFILSLIGFGFRTLTDKIYRSLPVHIKFWIRVLQKIIDFAAVAILGALIYKFWNEDWVLAAIISGIILIERISNIIKEEKPSIA
jgi:hypothetical protein